MKISQLTNSKLGMGIMLILLAGVMTNAWSNLGNKPIIDFSDEDEIVCDLPNTDDQRIRIDIQRNQSNQTSLAFNALQLTVQQRDLAMEERLVIELVRASQFHSIEASENNIKVRDLDLLLRELQEMEQELSEQHESMTVIRIQNGLHNQLGLVSDRNTHNTSQVIVLKDIKTRQ